MNQTRLAATIGVFVVGKFVLNTATRFVYAFLPAIARGLGVSTSAVGLLASMRWGVGAATPLAARLVGREHRKRIVLAGLVMFLVGALVTAASGIYAGAVVGFLLMGFGKPLFDSGSQAFVADHVPYERRARTLGAMETMWAISFLVGAPAAGWLIDRAGWSAPFWATAAVTAIVVVVLSFMALDDTTTQGDAGPFRWDAAVAGFLLGSALIVGSAEMVFVTFAAWLEETHGFSLAGLAALAVGIGLAELAAEAGVVAVTDRLGKRRAVAGGLLVAAVGFALIPLASASAGLAVVALVTGIAGFEFAFVSSISVGTELRPLARIQLLTRFVVAQAAGRAVAAVAALGLYATFGMGVVGGVAAGLAAVAGLVVRTHYGEDAFAEAAR